MWLGPLAAVATLIMMLLVLGGLRRSARINLVVVSVTVLALGVFVAAGLRHLAEGGGGAGAAATVMAAGPEGGFFYATALMFVAYTGYARIATLGEEVRDPARTIPRAIIVTLAVSAALYVLVALAALGALSPAALAASAREDAVPLEAAARAMELPHVSRLLALGAVTAMLGVLLNLVLGLSRVVLAMARRRELPPALARVDAEGTPRAAVVGVGLVVAAVAMLGRVEVTWAFSALTVLIYYAITHLAALRLDRVHRRYPPAIAWIGLAGCLGLAAFVPASVWVIGLALVAAGLAWQALARRLWTGA